MPAPDSSTVPSDDPQAAPSTGAKSLSVDALAPVTPPPGSQASGSPAPDRAAPSGTPTPEAPPPSASAPQEPPPSYTKLAMRNMVKKGRKSLTHFFLTLMGLVGLMVGLSYLTR